MREPLPVDEVLELALEIISWHNLNKEVLAKEGSVSGLTKMLALCANHQRYGMEPIESRFTHEVNSRFFFNTL